MADATHWQKTKKFFSKKGNKNVLRLAVLNVAVASLGLVLLLMLAHLLAVPFFPGIWGLVCIPPLISLGLVCYFMKTSLEVDKMSANLATVEKIRETERNYYHLVAQTVFSSGRVLRTMDFFSRKLQRLASRNDGVKIQKFLHRFAYMEQASRYVIHSGNNIVDALVGYWLMTAEVRKVRMQYAVRLDTVNIIDIDLAVLLGNALENAVDAASKAAEEDRWVKLHLAPAGDKLLLALDNGFAGQVLQVKDTYYSSKRQFKEPGLGITSMRHIVEKYKGSLHIDVRAKQFSLSILLHLPKEDKHGL